MKQAVHPVGPVALQEAQVASQALQANPPTDVSKKPLVHALQLELAS